MTGEAEPIKSDNNNTEETFTSEQVPLPLKHPSVETNSQQAEEGDSNMRINHAILELTPDALSVLAEFDSVREAAEQAIDVVAAALGELEGTALIPEAARMNVVRQANQLLSAAVEIRRQGRSTISLFGKYMTIHSLDEVAERLAAMRADFENVTSIAPHLDAFVRDGLPVIDKYVFDTHNPEQINDVVLNTVVLEDTENSGGEAFTEMLQKEGIVPEEPVAIYSTEAEQPFAASSVTRLDVNSLTWEGQEAVKRGAITPDVIIVPISTDGHRFMERNERYQMLRAQSYRVPLNQRPTIIYVADDGVEIPLYVKAHLTDDLMCTSVDELRNVLSLVKELKIAKTQPPLVEPAILRQLQEKRYDESADLRKWEHETADTLQSLRYQLARHRQRYQAGIRKHKDLRERMERLSGESSHFHHPWEQDGESEIPDTTETEYQVRTILDIATGEGRKAGPLARAGYYVVGLDISQQQLERGKQRFIEEGEGLRGERDNPELSYNVFPSLAAEGLLPQEPILDDQEAQAHYVTTKGDFMNLENTLTDLVRTWRQQHPDLPIEDFMQVERFQGRTEVAFDEAEIDWHSYCEMSDPEDERIFLTQVFNVLRPGAEFRIEIPDRSVDPYATAIQQYHEEHPSERYGIHREKHEDGEEEYTRRYFPGRHEMLVKLQAIGFDIDPEKDIETYLITKENPETRKKELKVKELVIRARKPFAA